MSVTFSLKRKALQKLFENCAGSIGRRFFSDALSPTPTKEFSATGIQSKSVSFNNVTQASPLSSFSPIEDLNAPQRMEEEIKGRVIRAIMSKRRIAGEKKKVTFRAFMCVGNGLGGLGIAQCPGDTPAQAVEKAYRSALNKMEYYRMYEDRTLFHDQYLRHHSVRLFCRSVPPKTGLRCHYSIQHAGYVMGLKDLSAHIKHSTNPVSVVKTFVEILRKQKTPEQAALDSGLTVHDLNQIYRYQHRNIVLHNLAVEKASKPGTIMVDERFATKEER